MEKLTTVLWFDHGEARKAAEFYAAIFPDSHVGTAAAAPSDFPSDSAGNEIVVAFTVLGRAFQGLNGGPQIQPNEAVSFMVLTDDHTETDRYWDAIVSAGGRESDCGWCQDRWGFRWQITPRTLIDALMAGGGEAKRAFDDDDDAPARRRRDRRRAAGSPPDAPDLRGRGGHVPPSRAARLPTRPARTAADQLTVQAKAGAWRSC